MDLIKLKEENYINSIRKEEENYKFLKQIQEEISISGNNKDKVIETTKDLSESQRQKLLNLYKEEINNLKQDIEIYKNRIINIRKKIN